MLVMRSMGGLVKSMALLEPPDLSKMKRPALELASVTVCLEVRALCSMPSLMRVTFWQGTPSSSKPKLPGELGRVASAATFILSEP